MRDRLDAIIDKAQQAVIDAGVNDPLAIDDARTAAVDAIMGLIEKDYRRVYGCHDVDEFYRDATEPVGPKPPQPPVVRGNEIDADETPERML